MNIIEEIFCGKICPLENFSETVPEFSRYSALISEKSEEIKKNLSEELLSLFLEYEEILECFYRICEEHHFVEGFKLGAKICSEIFKE
jgi:hypothetical protein